MLCTCRQHNHQRQVTHYHVQDWWWAFLRNVHAGYHEGAYFEFLKPLGHVFVVYGEMGTRFRSCTYVRGDVSVGVRLMCLCACTCVCTCVCTYAYGLQKAIKYFTAAWVVPIPITVTTKASEQRRHALNRISPLYNKSKNHANIFTGVKKSYSTML